MKKFVFIACLCGLLAGCDDADWFTRGDRVSAQVTRISGSPCEVHILVRSSKIGGDLSYRARLLTPDCEQKS